MNFETVKLLIKSNIARVASCNSQIAINSGAGVLTLPILMGMPAVYAFGLGAGTAIVNVLIVLHNRKASEAQHVVATAPAVGA